MKKALIISGTMSAAGFIIGSLFKLMFWPGAGALLIASILLVSLVFLPLLCIINVREKPAVRDRLIMVSGTMTGSLYCLSMLSLLQRWPIKHEIWMITLGVCFFLFIPLYFFTGIRNHATRMNTIISTVLLVAATGVQFTMTALRPERTTVVKQAALTASASKFVSQP
ncbi:MAG: hypothetical protein EOP49_10825 [Sphingobacteriales bacterium]|nr:MAG: hypothetical protein EOP49_10825 [Sphingobacteriales bacterium]